jgi:hypothetical protein
MCIIKNNYELQITNYEIYRIKKLCEEHKLMINNLTLQFNSTLLIVNLSNV